MTLRGMDTAAGLETGTVLETGSQELTRIAAVVGQAIHGFDWVGTDADSTRQGWDGTDRPRVDAVAAALAELARLIRQEAQAQDDASGAGSGARSGAAPAAAPTAPPTDPRTQALVERARAAGLQGEALTRYQERLATMTPEQRAALDPTTFRGAQATQPDDTTCGSSSLVMSRMTNNPAYAMQVIDGYDPVTGQTTGGSAQERFAAESQAMHDRTNGLWNREGDLQVPWFEGLGTAPGPLADEMSAEGGSGVPGTSYGVDYVRWEDRGSSFEKMVAASNAGHTVPVYVGDGWSPRHVVLVTGATADSVSMYEPSSGRTITVSREQWASDDVQVAGWGRPWAVVTPRD